MSGEMDKDYTQEELKAIEEFKELKHNFHGPLSERVYTQSLPKMPMTFSHTEKEVKFRLEGEALDYDWKDIDDEKWRVYVFPNGEDVEIEEPLKLYVSGSGGHRIFDAEEYCHYIPPGWIHIVWKAKEGQAHFRF